MLESFFAIYGSVLVQMVLAACLALSLYLPLMAGQLSLASPGFYALGGYLAAILSTKVFAGEGFSVFLVLLEMIVAGAISAALALVVGVPALRLRGIYLALATIAFVEILRVLALNLDLTGGAVGIFGIPQPVASQAGYLLLAVPLLVLAVFLIYRLERSRVGRAFVALREDELAADAMGIDPRRYKLLAFVLGAVLAGVVGALNAHVLNVWNTRQGTFDAAIGLLAFVLIGGSRTVFGPVLGAMLLTALPELLRPLGDLRLIINGLLLTLGAVFLPQGLVNAQFWRRRLRRSVEERR